MAGRLATLALWPFGIALTSWHYMWRTTPMHRREEAGDDTQDAPPDLPSELLPTGLQGHERGVGPLFHRRYATRIVEPRLDPEELVARVAADPNCVCPTEFAKFEKRMGAGGAMRPGDEYVVRMPGPWNGPVRVSAVTPASFRLATLEGHLEAGQIEFRCGGEKGELRFEIESWARSADRLSNLLYDHLRMAKEVQLHMWTSTLEKIVKLSGGRMVGGIEIETRRIDA